MSSLSEQLYDNFVTSTMQNHAMHDALVEAIERRLEFLMQKELPDASKKIRSSLYAASVAVGKMPVEAAVIVSEFLTAFYDLEIASSDTNNPEDETNSVRNVPINNVIQFSGRIEELPHESTANE